MILLNKLLSFYSDSLFRNASYLVANSIVGGLTGFVFWLIAARFYSAEDVGLASTILSLVGIIALISNFGFSISLIHFVSDFKDRATSLINSCFTVSASMGCLLSIIFLYVVDFFYPALSFIKSNSLFALFFVLFCILMILAGLQESVLVGYRKANLSFIKITIQSVLKLPFVFLLITFGSLGLVFAFGIAYFIAVIITLLILIPKVNLNYRPIPQMDFLVLKRIFLYSAGNYISWIFESLPNFLFPLLITKVFSAETTAYFYVAWTISSLVFVVPKSIATSLLAEASHDRTKIKTNLIKCLSFSFLLLIPILVTIYFFADKILMLFGETYALSGAMMLIVLTICALPMTFSNIFISLKRVQNDINTVIYINVFIISGTLIFSYILSSSYGIMSIAYSYLATNLLVASFGVIRLKTALFIDSK